MQELHERAARQADRAVVVGDGADRLTAALDADARVVDGLRELEARVGRRVVGDDDLELLVGLPDGRFERARDPALRVVDRDAHRDERPAGAHAAGSSLRCAASREANATIVSVGFTYPAVGKTEPPVT